MSSLNKVIVMGNLGQDPDLRQAGQTSVCNLSIATQNYVKDGENTTEWHRVVVWGKQAENAAKYLSKGRSVLVEGRLQTRSWENKEGIKQYTTEIVANNLQFVGNAKDASSPQKKSNGPLSLDEIPFG